MYYTRIGKPKQLLTLVKVIIEQNAYGDDASILWNRGLSLISKLPLRENKVSFFVYT